MAGPLELTTFADSVVSLPPEDAAFVSTRLGNKLRIRRSLEAPTYVINPQQYVGVVALPSGRKLTISPRIPTANLLYMLGVAYQFPNPFYQDLEQFEDLEELLEPVAEFFADLVDERIRAGLHRAYIDLEDNLPVVRGRIDFPRDLARNAVLRNRVYCRYSELTWDVPENQIIRYVCYLLCGWTFRRRDLQRRLVSLYAELEEVSLRAFTADDARGLRYHRFNEPYRRLHALCALFLEAASLSEASGTTEFRTFLLDANALFEEFVTQSLLDRISPPWDLSPQVPIALGQAGQVPMRPDLVVLRGAAAWAVADCKYKRVQSESDYLQHDYYQVLAYCTALGVTCGVLIYPRHEGGIEDQVQVQNTGIVLHRLLVDLSTPPAGLAHECDRLAEQLIARCLLNYAGAA